LFSILAVVIVFAILVLVHEFGHFVTAKRIGVRVEKFSIGFGKKLFGFKKGDTEYVVSTIPLGGYVKLAGENPDEETSGAPWELPSRSIWERFLIFVSGSFFNLLSAFVIISVLFMSGDTAIPTNSNVVGKVIEEYPAQAAGLKDGDKILSIDSVEVKTWQDITSIIHKNKGVPVLLLAERKNRKFKKRITPRTEEHKDIFGRPITMSFIGIAPEMITKRYNPLMSFVMGGKSTILMTGKVYQGLWLMLTRQVSFKNVAGPIGIFQITGQAAKSGIIPLLSLFAIISINLAVINLMPFPVLDGGHVLFLGLEKLRGRPLSKKTQETITQIALYVLIALIVFVSYNDVMRLWRK